MDDINTVLSAISSVGFPVVMCLVLIYNNSKQLDNLREVIENNTNTITKLYEKFDAITSFIGKESDS